MEEVFGFVFLPHVLQQYNIESSLVGLRFLSPLLFCVISLWAYLWENHSRTILGSLLGHTTVILNQWPPTLITVLP